MSHHHKKHKKKDHHKERDEGKLKLIVLNKAFGERPLGACPLTDDVAKQVEALWKSVPETKDASLLPVIGFPSNGNGVLTLTHTMQGMPRMKINGLTSNSPLLNNALYSVECTENVWLNLYEIMIPDLPGNKGELSTVQLYVNKLAELGLNVNGTHYHFHGSSVIPGNTLVAAIHHSSISMDPFTFSAKTLEALNYVSNLIMNRM